MKTVALALLLPLLAACSSAPVIVEEGPDSYMAYKEAATGFTGPAPLKVEAMQAASKHCDSLGKKYVVVSTKEIQSGAFGVYPGAEVHFRCLKEGDPDLKSPTIEPAPNTVIRVQHE